MTINTSIITLDDGTEFESFITAASINIDESSVNAGTKSYVSIIKTITTDLSFMIAVHQLNKLLESNSFAIKNHSSFYSSQINALNYQGEWIIVSVRKYERKLLNNYD